MFFVISTCSRGVMLWAMPLREFRFNRSKMWEKKFIFWLNINIKIFIWKQRWQFQTQLAFFILSISRLPSGICLLFSCYKAPDNRREFGLKFIFTARRQYAWPTKKKSLISNIPHKSFQLYRLSLTAHKYLSWQDLWSRSRIFRLRASYCLFQHQTSLDM